MVDLKYTSVAEIENIHAKLYETFRAGTCRPLEYRRRQLYGVARMCQENADALADALHKDIGKPKQEGIQEVSMAVSESLANAKQLEEWAAPEAIKVADYQKPWNPTIYKTSKGPVLIITPWNFPLMICLVPLIAAIASGNPAVVKPSEISSTYSQLFAELLPKYVDRNAYAVVNGAVAETTKLLELKWAHIHYTGNGRIARVIATAAAKHLTPVSLELGGKSPVIIDSSADLNLAAKRVLFGKTVNSGQACVAPDYVLVPKEKQADFVSALKKQVAAFFPEGALKSESFGRIISPVHFARVKGLLEKSKGSIAIGGAVDEKALRIEPTVVTGVKGDDSLMNEEIFGPLLPIVTVSNVDEAIAFINARDHPLALYAFTNDNEVKKKIINETNSGSLIFNDTMSQMAVEGMPFSGVGGSGYGYQFRKYGFDDLTFMRPTIDIPQEAEAIIGVRYPPFSAESLKIMSAGAQQPIPA